MQIIHDEAMQREDALPLDVLVCIAQSLSTKQDLAALRQASKATRDAVGEATLKLAPCKTLWGAQLAQLCLSFPRLTSLDLSGCRNLTEGSLHSLVSLAGKLSCSL